jgi:hypothetical protein
MDWHEKATHQTVAAAMMSGSTSYTALGTTGPAASKSKPQSYPPFFRKVVQ